MISDVTIKLNCNPCSDNGKLDIAQQVTWDRNNVLATVLTQRQNLPSNACLFI